MSQPSTRAHHLRLEHVLTAALKIENNRDFSIDNCLVWSPQFFMNKLSRVDPGVSAAAIATTMVQAYKDKIRFAKQNLVPLPPSINLKIHTAAIQTTTRSTASMKRSLLPLVLEAIEINKQLVEEELASDPSLGDLVLPKSVHSSNQKHISLVENICSLAIAVSKCAHGRSSPWSTQHLLNDLMHLAQLLVLPCQMTTFVVSLPGPISESLGLFVTECPLPNELAKWHVGVWLGSDGSRGTPQQCGNGRLHYGN